jgi:acetyl-CoA acetyltransferase
VDEIGTLSFTPAVTLNLFQGPVSSIAADSGLDPENKFRMTNMTEAFICDAVRTPIGRYGGSLAHVRADDLAAIPIRALMERNGQVDWDELDDVILGCANQAGEDNRNLARMAGLLAGLPDKSGGVTLNRLCGSGMDAVTMAARIIRGSDADMVLAGGSESMSRAARSARSLTRWSRIAPSKLPHRVAEPTVSQSPTRASSRARSRAS